MASTTLAITGMSCTGCSRSIERKLAALPGVTHAEVDLASGIGRIDHDPSATSSEALVAAIDSLGFAATVAATTEAG
jgi:copper chaperone CopZ